MHAAKKSVIASPTKGTLDADVIAQQLSEVFKSDSVKVVQDNRTQGFIIEATPEILALMIKRGEVRLKGVPVTYNFF